jgi:hypothetical protein
LETYQRELQLQAQQYKTLLKEKELLETSLRKKQDEVDEIQQQVLQFEVEYVDHISKHKQEV